MEWDQLSCPHVFKGQLSQDAYARGGVSTTQPSDINRAPGTAQTKNVCLAFPGKTPHCFRAMDLSSSPGQDLTKALGVIASYLHQAALHYLQVSPVLTLFIVHTSFRFAFPFFSLPLTCIS